MKLLFLGTGAGEWPPCKDENGEILRRFSSLLIDDCLLIDPCPTVFDSIKKFGVDSSKIKYVINTHKHDDHFSDEALKGLLSQGAKYVELRGGEIATLGKYKITAVEGNHSIPVAHFLIDDGERKLYYALDGAWLTYKEIQLIRERKLDYLVLDGTVGFLEGDYRIFEHNNLNMVIEIKKSLCERDVKRFCISHIATSLHTDHATLERVMSEHGIEVAYDGMITEI